MDSKLSASFQELREKRFTSERERLKHREETLLQERGRIARDLLLIRQKIRELDQQGQV